MKFWCLKDNENRFVGTYTTEDIAIRAIELTYNWLKGNGQLLLSNMKRIIDLSFP